MVFVMQQVQVEDRESLVQIKNSVIKKSLSFSTSTHVILKQQHSNMIIKLKFITTNSSISHVDKDDLLLCINYVSMPYQLKTIRELNIVHLYKKKNANHVIFYVHILNTHI